MSEEGKFSDWCCKRLFLKTPIEIIPVLPPNQKSFPKKRVNQWIISPLNRCFERGDFGKCSVSKAEHLGDDSSGESLPF